MINKQLLKSKMALFGDDQNSLAAALGISYPRLSAKMNAKQVTDKVKAATFTQNEMYIILKRYSLSPDEFVAIFFPDPDTDFHNIKHPQDIESAK